MLVHVHKKNKAKNSFSYNYHLKGNCLSNLPCPGLQRFKQNKHSWLIVTMEKLKVLDIDNLLIKVPQVNDVGGENW